MAQEDEKNNRNKRDRGRKPRVDKPKTKVVIRNLPPTLTEEEFRNQVEEKFKDAYNWFRYWKGKATLKQQVLSRAYVNFKEAEDVGRFHQEFNGHAYVNDKGIQFKAAVQFAPFQRVPKQRDRKRDPKQNAQIERDSIYKRFLDQLKQQHAPKPSAEVQLDKKEAEQKARLAANGGNTPVTITPLMSYMLQKEKKKQRRRRNNDGKEKGDQKQKRDRKDRRDGERGGRNKGGRNRNRKDGDARHENRKDGDARHENRKDGDARHENRKDGNARHENRRDGDARNVNRKNGEARNVNRKDGDARYRRRRDGEAKTSYRQKQNNHSNS